MAKIKSGWDTLPDHIRNDMVIQVFRELSLVKGHTRMLVLVTHGFLEMLVNALVEAKVKNTKKILDDSRSFPYSVKLLLLNELVVLDNQQYKLFDWFRRLRNRAAHDPIFQVTTQDLKGISEKKYRNPDKFYDLCMTLLGGFWNQYIDVFGPVFAPGVTGGAHSP